MWDLQPVKVRGVKEVREASELYLSYGEVQVGQEPGSRETEDTI